MIRASIVGASGYTGGELLRLLLSHPEVEVIQATSRSRLGEYIYQTHPNLRKRSTLKFSAPESLAPVDVLFLALPHGQAQLQINTYAKIASKIIDLSADFRLNTSQDYLSWYGKDHAAPEWLERFVYGLPELHREEIQTASYVSGVGCNATACNLALLPLVKDNLLDKTQPIIFEVKTGSSESGAEGNPGTHHPERANVIRTFSALGHRHTAEVIQEMGIHNLSLTITAIELVRGVLATAHARVKPGTTSQDLWKAYRKTANDNAFIRIVKEKRGIYRVPEPKILAGSNYVDLGFELDETNGHSVGICAIDNLMKGASGTAVQCLNLMFNLDETTGLDFPGLHPV